MSDSVNGGAVGTTFMKWGIGFCITAAMIGAGFAFASEWRQNEESYLRQEMKANTRAVEGIVAKYELLLEEQKYHHEDIIELNAELLYDLEEQCAQLNSWVRSREGKQIGDGKQIGGVIDREQHEEQ